MSEVSKKTLAVVVIAIAAALVLITYAASSYKLYYPNNASVSAGAKIGVYLNEACTSELVNGTTIAWGTVSAGSYTKTYWIKNTGNCNVTLTLTKSSLPSGWSLTWDYSGTKIIPNEVRKVIITLTVPSGASAGTYNWGSTITANEA